jgi:hypothetical protein
MKLQNNLPQRGRRNTEEISKSGLFYVPINRPGKAFEPPSGKAFVLIDLAASARNPLFYRAIEFLADTTT